MTSAFWRYRRLAIILTALAVSTAANAQTTPSPANQGGARFLVDFDEFSAFLSNEAKTIIADAQSAPVKWARTGSSSRRGPALQGQPKQTNTSRKRAARSSRISWKQMALCARGSGRSRSVRQAQTIERLLTAGWISFSNPSRARVRSALPGVRRVL